MFEASEALQQAKGTEEIKFLKRSKSPNKKGKIRNLKSKVVIVLKKTKYFFKKVVNQYS